MTRSAARIAFTLFLISPSLSPATDVSPDKAPSISCQSALTSLRLGRYAVLMETGINLPETVELFNESMARVLTDHPSVEVSRYRLKIIRKDRRYIAVSALLTAGKWSVGERPAFMSVDAPAEAAEFGEAAKNGQSAIAALSQGRYSVLMQSGINLKEAVAEFNRNLGVILARYPDVGLSKLRVQISDASPNIVISVLLQRNVWATASL